MECNILTTNVSYFHQLRKQNLAKIHSIELFAHMFGSGSHAIIIALNNLYFYFSFLTLTEMDALFKLMPTNSMLIN